MHVVENIAIRRMFGMGVWNETYQAKQATTLFEMNFEFSVAIWSENRIDQLHISNHNFFENYSITNLKQGSLITLQCEECLSVVYETKRTWWSDKGIACFGWMCSAWSRKGCNKLIFLIPKCTYMRQGPGRPWTWYSFFGLLNFGME